MPKEQMRRVEPEHLADEVQRLRELYTPAWFTDNTLAEDESIPPEWDELGRGLALVEHRLWEALDVFSAWYEIIFEAQDQSAKRLSQGSPLFWLSQCYFDLGFAVLAKRYAMLALCEDAINGRGSVHPHMGARWRLQALHGMRSGDVSKYAEQAFAESEKSIAYRVYPEWVLQQLDHDWMTEPPTPQEAAVCPVNRHYVRYLASQLGDKSGKPLEELAAYLLSCMPGCRIATRVHTPSSDYDVVCSFDGPQTDFRAELGRYFVCECKDWNRPADFSAFAKFCRVLDSVKSRFGILFSCEGISGKTGTLDAAREQLKVYQDRGMVIIVVTTNDIQQIANGGHLIPMLRGKYERVRLDLDQQC